MKPHLAVLAGVQRISSILAVRSLFDDNPWFESTEEAPEM